jgi:hypothetical protein
VGKNFVIKYNTTLERNIAISMEWYQILLRKYNPL